MSFKKTEILSNLAEPQLIHLDRLLFDVTVQHRLANEIHFSIIIMRIFSNKNRIDTLFEIFSVVLVVLVSLLSAVYLQGFEIFRCGRIPWWAIIISLAPVFLAYVVLKFILPPLLSSVLISSTVYVLSVANKSKISLVNEPLAWADIASASNLSVVPHYITNNNFLIIVLFIIFLPICIKINPIKSSTKRGFFTNCLACLAIIPISLFPYANYVNSDLSNAIDLALRKYGISYIPWDWDANIKKNGLPLHLVQTSHRTIPTTPNASQKKEFGELVELDVAIVDRPQNIIFILCEACWYDQDNFHDQFSKLRSIGLKEFRAISPVYGGGTVNASFEILTGLPAGGPLSGVIYQEYSSVITDSAKAYPRSLRQIGYTTIAAHNHYRKFWKRDVINPKLGFDAFFGLEDMDYDGPIWADDSVLFDFAIKELKNKKGRKFLYLTTVHTHGGYPFDNDLGEGDYQKRLAKTISEIAIFIDSALKQEPNTLILIFGDHKPALTRFFYEKGVFARDQFSSVGDKNEDFQFSRTSSRTLRGDVPAFIYHPNDLRASSVAKNANLRPFYCLSQLLDSEFTQAGVPAHRFSVKNGVCSGFVSNESRDSSGDYRDWIYSLSLF